MIYPSYPFLKFGTMTTITYEDGVLFVKL